MSEKGFTLIEILIVMLIISIVSGVAVLTISNNQRKQMEMLADKLVNLITLAEEEAMLRPATLGLAFTPQSYQFFRFVEPGTAETTAWQPLETRNFTRQMLPTNVSISIKVAGQTLELNGKPQIIITASGDVAPFIITIGKMGEKPAYAVINNNAGTLKAEALNEK
jgi:general secretion pathway protein H